MPESGLRIALVSHDARKPALVAWVCASQAALSRHALCGTGTTAVEVMQACPGARIATRHLDAPVFFLDPGAPHPHENDVQALIRIFVLADIPLALNRASADHLAEAMSLLRGPG